MSENKIEYHIPRYLKQFIETGEDTTLYGVEYIDLFRDMLSTMRAEILNLRKEVKKLTDEPR